MTGAFFGSWFLPGVWITLQVTFLSAALAFVISFVIGLARIAPSRIVRILAGIYFEVFRSTSSLVFMFWIAFTVPMLFQIKFIGMAAGIIALGMTYGAYGSEVVRGALAAVPPAQREAGIALNFTRVQRLRRIEIPQAWPEMLPPFNNLLIELLKGTSLISLIVVADMTFAGNLQRLVTGESAPVYTLLLVVYFVLAFLLTRGVRLLERRAKVKLGQAPPKGGLFGGLRERGAIDAVTGTTSTAGTGGAK